MYGCPREFVHKADDVFGGITDKNADLMRQEFAGKSFTQHGQQGFCSCVFGVAATGEDGSFFGQSQFLAQSFRMVEESE